MIKYLVYFSLIKLHEPEFWFSAKYWSWFYPVLFHGKWRQITQNNKLNFVSIKDLSWKDRIMWRQKWYLTISWNQFNVVPTDISYCPLRFILQIYVVCSLQTQVTLICSSSPMLWTSVYWTFLLAVFCVHRYCTNTCACLDFLYSTNIAMRSPYSLNATTVPTDAFYRLLCGLRL